MMGIKNWWRRLWQPGDQQPEYVVGESGSGDFAPNLIAGRNVTRVTYYATSTTGHLLPIMGADGCQLTQHLQPGHVHVTPAEIWPFVDIVPVGLVDDPSQPAAIEFCGVLVVDRAWCGTACRD